MTKILSILAIVCLPVATLTAAEPVAQIAGLIKTLSSDDTKQVDRARKELIALGDKIVDVLENHQTDDEQAVSSVKYVLNRICNYYIRIDPKRESHISSPGGNGTQVMLSIKNNSRQPVKLYWIDRTGNRVPYKDIKPGEEIQQRSFENHCWIIVDKDANGLGIYRSTYQDGRILVDQKFF